jgi:hypothetical protein
MALSCPFHPYGQYAAHKIEQPVNNLSPVRRTLGVKAHSETMRPSPFHPSPSAGRHQSAPRQASSVAIRNTSVAAGFQFMVVNPFFGNPGFVDSLGDKRRAGLQVRPRPWPDHLPPKGALRQSNGVDAQHPSQRPAPDASGAWVIVRHRPPDHKAGGWLGDHVIITAVD